MLTLVLRRGHVNRRENMATAEYRRGHGTRHCEKVIGPAGTAEYLVPAYKLNSNHGQLTLQNPVIAAKLPPSKNSNGWLLASGIVNR